MTVATDGIKYVRALVINNTSQDAFCRAYLDDVSSIDRQGVAHGLYNRAEFQLAAANSGDPESPNGYLIPANGAGRHFNIFFVRSADKFLSVQSKEWSDINRPDLPVGKYKVKLEISGKDCPTTFKQFIVDFDGGYNVSVE